MALEQFTPSGKGNNLILRVDCALLAPADSLQWIAPRRCTLARVKEVHSVVGGSGADCQIRRCQGTEAPGAGDALLTSALDLTTTVNTTVQGTLTATAANLVFEEGDRVGFDIGGTIGSYSGVIVLEFTVDPK